MQVSREVHLPEFYRLPVEQFGGGAPEPDLPRICFYEVDTRTKAVQRLIEVFADGRQDRDSIWTDPGPWGDVRCLVHGSWDDMERDYDLAPFRVDAEEFEIAWAASTDRAHPAA